MPSCGWSCSQAVELLGQVVGNRTVHITLKAASGKKGGKALLFLSFTSLCISLFLSLHSASLFQALKDFCTAQKKLRIDTNSFKANGKRKDSEFARIRLLQSQSDSIHLLKSKRSNYQSHHGFLQAARI